MANNIESYRCKACCSTETVRLHTLHTRAIRVHSIKQLREIVVGPGKSRIDKFSRPNDLQIYENGVISATFCFSAAYLLGRLVTV